MNLRFDIRPRFHVETKSDPPVHLLQEPLQGGEGEAAGCEGVGGVGRAQGRRGDDRRRRADDAAAGTSHANDFKAMGKRLRDSDLFLSISRNLQYHKGPYLNDVYTGRGEGVTQMQT